MANVIDRIRLTLDPQSAANALYDVLLQWKRADDELSDVHTSRNQRRREVYARRDAYERVLAAFMGVTPGSVRPLLRAHFKETTP
jgi:hypothetical protein